MDHEVRAEALRLYKSPFKYVRGYIYDANGYMVADECAHSLRIRGWGRISYMENPEQLQDAVGELIAEALTDYWNLLQLSEFHTTPNQQEIDDENGR